MKKDYVFYIIIAVATILFLLTVPGKRVLFYLEWQYHSAVLGEVGLYSPILREYHCSNGRACRHEQGHKEDHSLGWFSETNEFDRVVEILATCKLPLRKLPHIQFVINQFVINGEYDDQEFYAEIFTQVEPYGYDNLRDLLIDYAKICAETPTPQPTTTQVPTSTPIEIIHITPSPVVDICGALPIVSVSDILFFDVIQQPLDNPAFVSEQKNIVTQFRLASDYGAIGLVAHNYLAGALFPQIKMGQTIELTCEDGAEVYTVIEILRFQALQPLSPYSDYVDPESGAGYTNVELFDLIYNRPAYLILQTSIATAESDAWGRLFIIAERK